MNRLTLDRFRPSRPRASEAARPQACKPAGPRLRDRRRETIRDVWVEGNRSHVVYVKPEQVVEIALDGVQVSSRYAGGVALRFARVRRYRDDKPASEADTIERVQQMLR